MREESISLWSIITLHHVKEFLKEEWDRYRNFQKYKRAETIYRGKEGNKGAILFWKTAMRVEFYRKKDTVESLIFSERVSWVIYSLKLFRFTHWIHLFSWFISMTEAFPSCKIIITLKLFFGLYEVIFQCDRDRILSVAYFFNINLRVEGISFSLY